MIDLDAMAGRAQIPVFMPELVEKGNEIMDIEACASAARKRLAEAGELT